MSYGLYIGKNHTANGVAYLAGYGDEPSSHWLSIVPAERHRPGSTITVGVTAKADLPGMLSDIPQVPETARHVGVNYSYYKGVPAPLTNGGLNEHGVAVRDVWSTSRRELIDMTPADQTGPNYSDLARLVLERAHSASEGVDLIADLITQHGYSSYGGNSHLIADHEQAWVVIEFAGGQGLWVAERLGPDSIRASRPGYIGIINEPQSADDRFRHPDHFFSFAQAQGWHHPDDPFDVNLVYGDGKGRWDGVQWIERELAGRAATSRKITLADAMWAVRTERLTGDTAGYGQVVPLTNPSHRELRMLWHSQVGALAAPFVPVFLGNTLVPPEFRQHRYLTAGEAKRFLDSRHFDQGEPGSLSAVPQGVESTRSATAVFKRLLYLILGHADEYLPEITEVWEATERRLADQAVAAVSSAEVLLDAGRTDLATGQLTYFTNTELEAALGMASTLADALEVRTKVRFGVDDDPRPKSADQLW